MPKIPATSLDLGQLEDIYVTLALSDHGDPLERELNEEHYLYVLPSAQVWSYEVS